MLQLVTIEENHESLYVWHYARAHSWLHTDRPAALVYLDEYANLSVPRFRRPLGRYRTIDQIEALTYSELAINNFIWPAIYQGLFDRMYWVRQRHSEAAALPRLLRIAAADSTETSFLTSNPRRKTPLPSDSASVEYAPITLQTWPQNLASEYVLNINLTYFCGSKDGKPNDVVLEISEPAYRDFCSNRYHFLRLVPRGIATPAEQDGRFYLYFGDRDYKSSSTPLDKPALAKSIAQLVRTIAATPVKPSLIVLCRSYLSGYVLEEHGRFVERELLGQLETIAPLHIHAISQLTAGAHQHA